MIPESSYEAWIKPIKAVTKYDYENDDIHLIPELIKPVTLTVPA